MNILIVLTSHDQLGDTGEKTGFWLEEFATPYYVLKDAGAAITLASPKGGQPPLDPKSDLPENLTEATKRFRADKVALAELASTKTLADVSANDFDAVFYEQDGQGQSAETGSLNMFRSIASVFSPVCIHQLIAF